MPKREPLLFTDAQVRGSEFFRDVLDIRQLDKEGVDYSGKTYTQELLDVPVPLENRIAHLVTYVRPVHETYTAAEIAERIGFEPTYGVLNGSSWVNRTSISIGLSRVAELSSQTQVYESPALEVLEEEWAWHKRFYALEEMASTDAIARAIGRDQLWVRKTAADLEIYETLGKSKAGRQRPLYPKILASHLRHITLLTVPSGDSFNVHQLAVHFGQEWEWVKRRLDKSGLVSTKRVTPYGLEVEHYPHESYAIIEKAVAEKAPPAGDWMTVSSMANELGKSKKWVQDRMEEYKDVAELRLDDRGAETMHYPPYVFKELKKEVDRINALPVIDDTVVSLKGLAMAVGHTTLWVENRLAFTDVQPEERRNASHRVYMYYKKELAVAALKALPPDILETTH